LNNIDYLAIAFEDVDELRCLAVPDEDVARVAAAHYIVVLQAEVVDVFHCPHVAVASVDACVRCTWHVKLDLLPLESVSTEVGAP
jgi:hypothetical protein